MHDYHFRCATPTDATPVSQLVNAAYRPAAGAGGWTHEAALISGARTNPAQLCDLLQRPRSSVLLACNTQQQIHGCVHVEAHGQQAHIGLLAVLPTLQGSGLGKLLLARAELFAVQQWQVSTLLLTVVQARETLRQFYLRRGYVPNGERFDYPLDAGAGQPYAAGLWVQVLVKPAEAVAGAGESAPIQIEANQSRSWSRR